MLQKDEALADTVGITEQDLSLSFVAVDADGAEWPLGEQLLPLRVYRVLGPQGFARTSEHYSPWPAVIDPGRGAIEGTPAHHDPVVDALVEWIYTDLGLVYDTASGSSFYSEYFGWTWDEPHFYLTEFLSRQNGDIVNCSDSGNILASYSNMLGAHLKHIVILDDFNLNFIKAIGHAEHTSCPFGAPWGCGFSYHAVTTDDDGLTVWDTTLALDGDADPGSAPSTEWLVQTIPGQDYLDALVRSGSASYQYPARITIE